MTPGVMAQGLGGSSVIISEGLSVFHNPAHVGARTYNFTLARWLYATNYLAVGATHDQYSFGITYLNYGKMQGFDELGNATNIFTPYDICAAIGYRLGIIGFALKGFTERLSDHTLYGIAGTMAAHLQRGNLELGAKVDNMGKEFAENTTIPYYVALGLKYKISKEFGIVMQLKAPDIEFNSGVLYIYQDLTLLLGMKYLKPQEPAGLHFDDIGLTGGVIVSIDDYRIGYSIVYGYSSVAHQFSVTFMP